VPNPEERGMEKIDRPLKDTPPPFSLGAAVAARRQRCRVTRKELARRTGIADWTLADYEAGRQYPTPAELTRLADCLQTTPERLREEGELLAAIRDLPAGASLAPARAALDFARDLRAAFLGAIQAAVLPAARPCTEEAGPERRRAEASWRELERLDPEAQRAAIDQSPLFRRWGVAERLCSESEALLATAPQRALQLAELALRVAERVAGDPAWRRHLQGYAWAFIAKARFAAGDRVGAEQAAATGRSLWNPDSIAEADFLQWPQIPGLESCAEAATIPP
jgi:transcriptional regulator with XRE-family HTH domain